jgi:hypothetical protein
MCHRRNRLVSEEWSMAARQPGAVLAADCLLADLDARLLVLQHFAKLLCVGETTAIGSSLARARCCLKRK